MTFKALLFDVDGTLAETEEVHRAAFNEAFKQSGLDWYWDQDLYHILLGVTGGKERISYHVEREGLPVNEFPFLRVAKLHELKTAAYTRMVDEGQIELAPGISQLLREARAAGIRLAITTTTSRVNVERLFQATLGSDGLSWFEVQVTGDRVAQKKPDPEIYELAVRELGLYPGECLAIEDAPQGLQSSLGAGVPTVVLESAYSSGAAFEGALRVVKLDDPRPSLLDLQDWFQLA